MSQAKQRTEDRRQSQKYSPSGSEVVCSTTSHLTDCLPAVWTVWPITAHNIHVMSPSDSTLNKTVYNNNNDVTVAKASPRARHAQSTREIKFISTGPALTISIKKSKRKLNLKLDFSAVGLYEISRKKKKKDKKQARDEKKAI